MVMRSRAVTLTAGEAIVCPLTATRPAAIQSSASRREHRPARAITLAMRSPWLDASPAGDGRARSGLSRLGPSCLGLSRLGLSRLGPSRSGLSRLGLSRLGLSGLFGPSCLGGRDICPAD